MFRIVILIIFLSFVLTVNSQSKEYRIVMCYNSGMYPQEIRNNLRIPMMQSLNRVIKSIDTSFEAIVKINPCSGEEQSPFYGQKDIMFCREDYLGRLIYASAIISAEEVFIEDLSTQRQIKWESVFKYANAKIYDLSWEIEIFKTEVSEHSMYKSSDLEKIMKLADEIITTESNQINPATIKSPDLRQAIIIYRGLIDYTFGFIVGHESFHYAGNRCLVSDISTPEKDGSFVILKNLQSGNNLFRPLDLEITELGADKCALRILEKVDSTIALSIPDSLILTKIRRNVSDALSGPILLGYELSNYISGEADNVLNVIPGYLYPLTRLLLINSVARSNEIFAPWAVKISGNTAKTAIEIIQQEFGYYPESTGYIPDELLKELPTGIEEAYKSGIWTEDSFICKPKKN